MAAERRGWLKHARWTVLVSVSGALIALNLAGHAPLEAGVLGALRPALAFVGEADPPRIAPGADAAPEILGLRASNARLVYEVYRLRDLLASATGASFEAKRYPFRALPAQVLCRAGTPGFRRVVLVDRGRRDGVARGMGVAKGDRVVGRVHRVFEDLCTVLLLTDPACRIRATFLPPGDPPDDEGGDDSHGPALCEGLCEGDVDDPDAVRFRLLPRSARLRPGAPVVTTGFAGVFPAGMSLGEATSVAESLDGLFLDVTVRPAVAGEPIRSVMILLPALPGDAAGEVSRGGR